MTSFQKAMKVLFMALLTLISLNINAQTMKTPTEIVTNLFVATDQANWEVVSKIFDEKVILDYSSMSGNPAAELTSEQIITAWKTILPGFEHTHHQLGSFLSNVEGTTATVSCYGTATHYLPTDGGNVWTVVGTYDFILKKKDDTWRISSMKFNFKYQDGNTALPEKAMEKVKS